MTQTWPLPSHTPNISFYHRSESIFYYCSHCHAQFNSKLMTSTLEPHPRSHLHVILLSYWLMICLPSPSLIIQQYLSRMHFICVSDSLFPKTTTWCNWKNIQFYFPLTQLPFLEQTNPILHLEHMLGGNNDIYERGARIGYWYCCRDETNTICSGGANFDSFFNLHR